MSKRCTHFNTLHPPVVSRKVYAFRVLAIGCSDCQSYLTCRVLQFASRQFTSVLQCFNPQIMLSITPPFAPVATVSLTSLHFSNQTTAPPRSHCVAEAAETFAVATALASDGNTSPRVMYQTRKNWSKSVDKWCSVLDVLPESGTSSFRDRCSDVLKFNHQAKEGDDRTASIEKAHRWRGRLLNEQ